MLYYYLESWPKHMRQTLVLNSALPEKFNPIFEQFLLVLTKLSFWEEDWTLGYNSLKIWDLPDIPDFLRS